MYEHWLYKNELGLYKKRARAIAAQSMLDKNHNIKHNVVYSKKKKNCQLSTHSNNCAESQDDKVQKAFPTGYRLILTSNIRSSYSVGDEDVLMGMGRSRALGRHL
jgi:hypothetical protein